MSKPKNWLVTGIREEAPFGAPDEIISSHTSEAAARKGLSKAMLQNVNWVGLSVISRAGFEELLKLNSAQ